MRAQCSSYLEPHWLECCVAFVFSLSGCFLAVVLLLFFCFTPTTPPVFPLLSQCDRCPDVPLWGLMAGLRRLLAIGAFYCLGACWSQWRPLDIPGTHLPLSLMQLLLSTSLYLFFILFALMLPVLYIRHLTEKKHFTF